MSLWWAKKEQLDAEQLRLIEQLPLRQSRLILGPPGSGKTNVLLRRAQFVRSQAMPNVLVLTFTRALTEFVKTGCFDSQRREIFPRSLVSTLEMWIRTLYKDHGRSLPDTTGMDLSSRKCVLAAQALEFVKEGKMPLYDTIFIDEAQDLLEKEVELLCAWSQTLFLVGDDRQKIFERAAGLQAVRTLIARLNEERLQFHYRLAPELCAMADRIQTVDTGAALSTTSQYNGPRPGRIQANGPLPRAEQIQSAARVIKDQLRVYGDLIEQGDRIGVIVPKKDDREIVLQAFEADRALARKAQIIRARSGDTDDRNYSPSFDAECPVSILTEKGSKGLEFRTVHWLFCDESQYYRTTEIYYTVVTRAKTRLDLYFATDLPTTLAKSYSPPAQADW